MNIVLCDKCSKAAESAYTVKRLGLVGKNGKCGHCGRKATVIEYELRRKALAGESEQNG